MARSRAAQDVELVLVETCINRMFSACDYGIAGEAQSVKDIHVPERGRNEEMEAVNKPHGRVTFAPLSFRQHIFTHQPHVGCISGKDACHVDQ